MRLNWKYFVARSANALIVLFIVVMIISIFLGVTYKREQMVTSRVYVNEELEDNYSKVANMSFEERQEWTDKKQEEFRVGNYSREEYPFRRSKDVFSKSLLEESFKQATKVMQLDFGRTRQISIRTGEGNEKNTVLAVILRFLPRTILIYGTAVAIYIPMSIYIGAKSAMHKGKKRGGLIKIANMIGSSVPIWWGAFIGLIIFAFYLGWVRFSPMPFPSTEGLPYYMGILKRMIFPVAVIVLIKLNPSAWTTRNLVDSELEEDYVEAGRAKGLPEKVIVNKHALRSSGPPIISKSVQLIIGAIPELIVFEALIGWPGVGFLFYKALNVGGSESIKLDVNLLVGLAFFVSLLTVTLHWLADIMYGVADPRVKIDDSE